MRGEVRAVPRTIESKSDGFALGSVVSGVLYAFVCTAMCAVVYAIFIASMPMTERTLPIVARVTVMLSAFLGGLAAGHKSDRVGWLHGGLVGLVYIVGITGLGRLTGSSDVTAAIVIQRLVVTIIVSAIGGIAGVNL